MFSSEVERQQKKTCAEKFRKKSGYFWLTKVVEHIKIRHFIVARILRKL